MEERLFIIQSVLQSSVQIKTETGLWQIFRDVISAFRHRVDKKHAVLCKYAVSNGKSLPKFRENLSVRSLGVCPLKMVPIG
jgi:hypothetical protein